MITVLRKDIQESQEKVDSIYESTDSLKDMNTLNNGNKALLYYWINSFSRRIYDTLLNEVSLLAQPTLPKVCQDLPLLSCSKYSLIARYPERNISFWYPDIGIP